MSSDDDDEEPTQEQPDPLTHLTQDSLPTQTAPTQEENYVQSTSKDFHIRLQFWLATLGISDSYPDTTILIQSFVRWDLPWT